MSFAVVQEVTETLYGGCVRRAARAAHPRWEARCRGLRHGARGVRLPPFAYDDVRRVDKTQPVLDSRTSQRV
jgi:hypothetical protein